METREALFRPFRVGSLTLANRVVLSPMGRAMSADGVPPVEAYSAYYRRRVEGGVGLLVTEATAIMHPAANLVGITPMIGGAAEAAWTEIVSAVHEAGGRIVAQLWHSGMHRMPGFDDVGPMGPSGLVMPFHTSPDAPVDEPIPAAHVMTPQDISDVISSFGDAVAMAQRIGFDGAEIHAGHGFLIDQFLWERTNRRSDEYGGSLENRVRFAAEVVAECRQRVGSGYPIFMRLSQFKVADYNARLAAGPEDWERIVLPLAEAGVDVFDCSQRRFWEPAFENSELNLAGWTRKITGLPVITCGSVGMARQYVELDPFASTEADLGRLPKLCAMLERDEVDLVSIGRSLLADPAWAAKVREGRDSEIVPYSMDSLTNLY